MSTARNGDRGQPETIQQARHWERVKNKYLGAGACAACSSQAAWGHQLGFSTVRPPCTQCMAISSAWPWECAYRTHGMSPAPQIDDEGGSE